MRKRTKIAPVVAAILVLATTSRMLRSAAAQKDSVPHPQNGLAIGEDNARQLLLLIDTDRKGKISKQEWMSFMEAEFERLDKSKKGELDVRELAQSQVQVRPFSNAGK